MGTLEEKVCLVRARASCLENIRTLNVWGSDLHDISIIRKMVNVEVLNVSVNNISTLADLSFCPRIKEVYLRRNKITTLEEIKFLKNLPNLQVLWLSDNPCSNQENYRNTILRNLPNLKKIDSDVVTADELEAAITDGDLIANEENLPIYDGLDLNKTLTMEMLKLHISNVTKDEKESLGEINPTEESLPKHHDEELVDQPPKLDVENTESERNYTLDSMKASQPSKLDVENTENESNDTLDCLQTSQSLTSDSLKASQSLTSDSLKASQSLTSDSLKASQSLTSDSLKASRSLKSDTRSNTLSAILLLLEELNCHELHEVKLQADTLLVSKYEKIDHTESVLVD